MASTSASAMVPTSETDYLDEDKPLRGQNYVCLSFLSPEEVLADKEAFTFQNFVASFSKELGVLIDGLKTKYPDDVGSLDVIKENHLYMFDDKEMQDQYRFYKSVHGQALDQEFQKRNDFKTSVRGIKVRGVFDTLKEAQVRADVLKRGGDKFDIYVGQVGCWCPWSPNPHDLEDQQYTETQLNTLMLKYKENMEHRDEHYQQRKDEKIKQAREAVKASKPTESVESAATDDATTPATPATPDAPEAVAEAPAEA